MRRLARLTLGAITAGVVFAGTRPADALTDIAKVRACQRKIYTQTRGFARATASRIERCTNRVIDCNLRHDIDGADLALCLERAQGYCRDLDDYVAVQQTNRKTYATTTCSAIAASEVTQLTDGLGFGARMQECAATTVAGLMDCIFARVRCRAEHQVFRIDPRSADALTTAGLAASFPCVGP